MYTRAGARFKLVGIMTEGNLLEVLKALYIFTTSGNRQNTHLLHTLRVIGFKRTIFDPDVCIKGRKGGCNRIVTHTDDVLVVAVDSIYIFTKLK